MVAGTVSSVETDTAYDAEVAAAYDDNYSDPLSLAENRVLSRLLDETMERTPYLIPRILDVGCGTGLVPDLLRAMPQWEGYWEDRYLGVDASIPMLNRAQQKHTDLAFAPARMEALGLFVYERFNVVVSTFVLAYSEDILEAYDALEAMRARLVDGGRLLLVTCSERFTESQQKTTNHIVNEKVEVLTFDAETLEMLALSAGFNDVRVTGLGYGSRFAMLEYAALGKHWPDLASYLVLEASN